MNFFDKRRTILNTHRPYYGGYVILSSETNGVRTIK